MYRFPSGARIMELHTRGAFEHALKPAPAPIPSVIPDAPPAMNQVLPLGQIPRSLNRSKRYATPVPASTARATGVENSALVPTPSAFPASHPVAPPPASVDTRPFFVMARTAWLPESGTSTRS
jgi:hypothetical protein